MNNIQRILKKSLFSFLNRFLRILEKKRNFFKQSTQDLSEYFFFVKCLEEPLVQFLNYLQDFLKNLREYFWKIFQKNLWRHCWKYVKECLKESLDKFLKESLRVLKDSLEKFSQFFLFTSSEIFFITRLVHFQFLLRPNPPSEGSSIRSHVLDVIGTCSNHPTKSTLR